MRILGLIAVMAFFTAGTSIAATIDLVDGRVVQGDIIKKDSKTLQINVDGVTMTYYADEIKDVDGQSFAAQEAATPAALPEAAANPVSTPQTQTPEDTAEQEKKELILKFIDVFGTRKALASNFELMLRQIGKEKPEEAQKIREVVKVDEIIDRLIPIYDRHFTAEDLKAFIAFYGSPEGQKLIVTIPLLMKESVQESVKYMQEKFPETKKGQ
jgi:hypothetical protein